MHICMIIFLFKQKDDDMPINLNTKSYLTRSLLNKVFKRPKNNPLTTDEIDNMVLEGLLIKRFSYYQPSEVLLRKLNIIYSKVKITQFAKLAKKQSFVLKEIQEIFNNCHIDVARIVAEKYFQKKWNYYYKNDLLIDMLLNEKEEVEI